MSKISMLDILDEFAASCESERRQMEAELLDTDPFVRRAREAGYDVTDPKDPGVIFLHPDIVQKYYVALGFVPPWIRPANPQICPPDQMFFCRKSLIEFADFKNVTSLH